VNTDPFYIRAADWLSNGVLRAVNSLVRPLPYERRVHTGGAIGRVVFTRIAFARRRIEKNLDRIYPDLDHAARKDLIRAVADNFGRVMVEEGMMDRLIDDPGRFHPSGPGWRAYQDAIARGDGPIVVTAHYGNWEGIRAVSKGLGRDLPAVYRPHNNPYYNADFVASLEVLSPLNFPKGGEGTKALLKHVKQGGAAFILIDQKQTGAPLIDFLGHPAETTLTAAKLARGATHPLFPAISRRRADGLSFDVIFGEPIPDAAAEDRIRAANTALSAWIEEEPGQWFWFHRRWR
jgi:KDO2-lipid IV(A) lauroyltransferase